MIYEIIVTLMAACAVNNNIQIAYYIYHSKEIDFPLKLHSIVCLMWVTVIVAEKVGEMWQQWRVGV